MTHWLTGCIASLLNVLGGGIADAEIKAPSADYPELSKVLSLKPRVGQSSFARFVLSTRNSALVPVSCRFIRLCLFQILFKRKRDVCNNSECDVYLWCDDLRFALIYPG